MTTQVIETQQNPISTAAELLRAEEAREAGASIQFRDWALKVPEPKTGTLDFARFPYQRELYEEGADEKEMVVMKATQVGVSTWALRWSLYHSDTKGLTGLYVFPTKSDMWDFSAARVKPAIDGSEYLMSRMPPGESNNKGLKRIGAGFVYFRGSESKRGLDSVDADTVMFDEYDTLTQANIPDAERRISGSPRGLVRRIGVPSIPDFGIAKNYEASDKRQWIVKCERCNEQQDLDFHQNVDLKTAERICRRCRKPIDVRNGQWVAMHPGRDVRGYHMPRLIVPNVDVKAIIVASEKKAGYERQVHYNKDLGVAFAPEEGRLSASALDAAQSAGGHVCPPMYDGPNVVTMGVDVASARPLTVRISEHLRGGARRALFIGEIDAESTESLLAELDRLMRAYRVRMAVIDGLPERRLAKDFRDQHRGQVYISAYTESLSSGEPWKVDDDMHTLVAQRVAAIDDMMADVRAQRNLLPAGLPDSYREEMQALVRVAEQTDEGKVRVYYLSTGADDYAHAEVYDRLAWMMFERRQLIEAALAETYTTIDDHLDFERANLDFTAEEPQVYQPGAGESMYDDGFGGGESAVYDDGFGSGY